jgi:hypothetical protein
MHSFHIEPTLFLLKTPTSLNGLNKTKQFIRLIEIMSTYLGLTLTLTVEMLLFDNRVLNESVEYTFKLPFNYLIL